MKANLRPKALCILTIMALLLPGILAVGTVKAQALIWVQTSNPSSGIDDAKGVAVDGTGIYVVGYDASPGGSDYEWRIEKRNTDGTILWAQSSNPSASYDVAYGVAVDSSGLYVVGFDDVPGGVNREWRMEKRDLSTGAIIWTQTSNASSGDDQAYAVAVDGSGIYVIGYDNSPGGIDLEWRIEKRDRSTGAIIWAQTSNPSAGDERAQDVAVDSTGVYIVGYDASPGGSDTQWRIEKRDLATGTLLWSQISNPSPGIEAASGVAADGGGIYVVGYDDSPGGSNWEWRIEKRDLTTGAIIWAQASNPSSGDDRAYKVIADGTGFYLVGYDNSPGGANYEWRIEKRNSATGAIIWAQTSNPSPGLSNANDVAVSDTSLYVVGYDSVPGGSNWEWRIEKRDTGAPAADFSISSSVSTVSIPQGGSGSVTITVGSLGGFNSPVSFTASWVGTAPSGVNLAAIPAVTPPSGSSANSPLAITADPSASVGTFTLRVTGTSGSLNHNVGPDLTVQITALTTTTSTSSSTSVAGPDFSISSSSSAVSVTQEGSASATITVGSLNGFSSAVTLTPSWVGTAPSDVNFALPTPITPSSGSTATSPLSVNAGPSASTGSFTLRVTATSGSISHTVDIDVQVTGATTSTTTTPAAPKCLIATATFGSELSPEVQFLRNFRDNSIMKTYAGSNFMVAFNTWYYSFSPYIANYLSDHWVERNVMKGVLYPLIGMLLLSEAVFSATKSNPEIASLLTGLLASTLIGAFYLGLPVSLLRAKVRRLGGWRRQRSLAKLLVAVVLVGVGGMLMGEEFAASTLVILSTSAIVLSTLFLSAAVTSATLAKRVQHLAKTKA
jgi:hypothetical protein